MKYKLFNSKKLEECRNAQNILYSNEQSREIFPQFREDIYMLISKTFERFIRAFKEDKYFVDLTDIYILTYISSDLRTLMYNNKIQF